MHIVADHPGLPRRVIRHFKATGKGYQTRISRVLASYVDAMKQAG